MGERLDLEAVLMRCESLREYGSQPPDGDNLGVVWRRDLAALLDEVVRLRKALRKIGNLNGVVGKIAREALEEPAG
jgi:hypothetical protein